jgi:hypothetical protein
MSCLEVFELRIGNSLVPLDAYLFRTDANGVSAAADLTSYTVTFTLINAATGTALFTDDPVTITTNQPGNTTLTETLQVFGVSHHITTNRLRTSFTTQEPVIDGFILDSVQFGVLGTSVLCY